MVIMEAVTNRAKRAGKALTPQGLYAFFVEQCRQNLHLVICMSPGGSAAASLSLPRQRLLICCHVSNVAFACRLNTCSLPVTPAPLAQLATLSESGCVSSRPW